ncbi:hypothetical protein ES703_52058 [subsurface metagenome]
MVLIKILHIFQERQRGNSMSKVSNYNFRYYHFSLKTGMNCLEKAKEDLRI